MTSSIKIVLRAPVEQEEVVIILVAVVVVAEVFVVSGVVGADAVDLLLALLRVVKPAAASPRAGASITLNNSLPITPSRGGGAACVPQLTCRPGCARCTRTQTAPCRWGTWRHRNRTLSRSPGCPPSAECTRNSRRARTLPSSTATTSTTTNRCGRPLRCACTHLSPGRAPQEPLRRGRSRRSSSYYYCPPDAAALAAAAGQPRRPLGQVESLLASPRAAAIGRRLAPLRRQTGSSRGARPRTGPRSRRRWARRPRAAPCPCSCRCRAPWASWLCPGRRCWRSQQRGCTCCS
eukprot:scaffold34_cov271-Prasinococcus_capsulatus_cf.AAC.4